MMAFESEITIRMPLPSDGLETVLVLFGIGALLTLILGALQHRQSVAKALSWLTVHPWENASRPVNLLSWVAMVCVGPLAAILFVLAVNEAFTLLANEGESETGAGSLGRGAVIVALISAPFVIWRSVVAQKTVNVTEQGHITDRINAAVEGLGSEKTVKVREFLVRSPRKNGTKKVDEDDKPMTIDRTDGSDQGSWEVSEETQPNLEVRIGAILALERLMRDSKADRATIENLLIYYILENSGSQPVGVGSKIKGLRKDLEAAIRVALARRPDLQEKEIAFFDQCFRDLRGLLLAYVRILNSDFNHAQLNVASLEGSSFHTCNFYGCHFRATRFTETRFFNCLFVLCYFRNLKSVVNMRLHKSKFKQCAFRNIDLSNFFSEQHQLMEIFADGSVKLGDGLRAPEHWHTEKLNDQEFMAHWREWLNDSENYPPDAPHDK